MSEERNDLPDFNLPGDDSPQDPQQPVESTQSVEQQDTPTVDPNAKAIFDIYRDEGFISREDFDGTYDGLKQLLVEETKNLEDAVFNSVVNVAPSFAKPLIELVLAKGNDLTQDELTEFFSKVQPGSYSEDNLPSEQFLTDYYTNELGWDEEDVQDRLETLKDKEKLEVEAKKLFKKQEQLRQTSLSSTVEEAKLQREQLRQQQELFTQTLNQNFNETYQKPKAQKLYNEFYSGSFKDKMESVLANPTHLHKLIEFISYFDGEKFDEETYKKEAFSPSTRQVQKQVQSYWSNSGAATKSKDADPGETKKINLKDFKFTD